MKKLLLLSLTSLALTSCGAGINSAKEVTPPISKDVYTFDCETTAHKPETIMIYCADAGAYVEKIKWSTWTPDIAHGSGVYTYNDCDPSCAEGTMHSTLTEITLSKPKTFKGKRYLSYLHLQTPDGSPLSDSLGDTFDWDLMEFAAMMAQE